MSSPKKRYCEKNFGAPKFGQVMWGFKENLRGECQKLMKIVKLKTIKWIQKRPTNLNVLQGLGFITYACFISIHAYSDHESPKKRYDLHFEKTLNWKFQNFVPQDPTKRQHTDTRDTSIVPRVLQASYIIHWACMQEKPAPMKGKIYKKIDFNLKKKIVREFTFFLLKNTKTDATKLNYHVSYRRPFQRLIVYRFESFRTHNSSQKRTK